MRRAILSTALPIRVAFSTQSQSRQSGVSTEVLDVGYCLCATCRKASGSVIAEYLSGTIPAEDLAKRKGLLRIVSDQSHSGRDCVKTHDRHVAVGTRHHSRLTLHKVWRYLYHDGNFILVVWRKPTAPRSYYTGWASSGQLALTPMFWSGSRPRGQATRHASMPCCVRSRTLLSACLPVHAADATVPLKAVML